jgi:phosphoglycerate-specific signal transduction histidine kinase
MVTIKTFAQLLGDRYDDEHFRARFQEVVGSDVERMDELLEVMIEFADFAQPKSETVALDDKVKAAARDVGNECAKRQTRIQLTGPEKTCQIHADEAQLEYILKNVLLAVLAQARMGTDIHMDIGPDANVTISYLREGARLASVSQYLASSEGDTGVNALPLRVLLAKQLVERNGGRLVTDQSANETETVRLEFGVGERRKES